jgi:hypothetical protein
VPVRGNMGLIAHFFFPGLLAFSAASSFFASVFAV